MIRKILSYFALSVTIVFFLLLAAGILIPVYRTVNDPVTFGLIVSTGIVVFWSLIRTLRDFG